MNCINCSNKLNTRNKYYCDNHCQKEYEYKKYISEWHIGNRDGLKGQYQISNHIRRYLMEKYNYSCSKCGWSEKNPYNGVMPLEVEHIDGNYKNNSEKNLILLCPNCHSLTATYKGANKGKGRKGRKKYSLYDNPELGQKDRV